MSEDVYNEGFGLESFPQDAVLASSTNPEFGVGTSNTAIFAGLARKLPYGVNYVYWREDRYTYVFAYGRDLELVGTNFRADSVDTVTYNTVGESCVRITKRPSLMYKHSKILGEFGVVEVE